jgi:hypothetical protein
VFPNELESSKLLGQQPRSRLVACLDTHPLYQNQ